jgi:hypothetical protein
VDYRLGPEHKLPIMLQDTLAVYQWVGPHIEAQEHTTLTEITTLPIGMGECLPTQRQPGCVFLHRRKCRRGSGSCRCEPLR